MKTPRCMCKTKVSCRVCRHCLTCQHTMKEPDFVPHCLLKDCGC